MEFFCLVRVLPENKKNEENFLTYAAAHHQAAIQMFWLDFLDHKQSMSLINSPQQLPADCFTNRKTTLMSRKITFLYSFLILQWIQQPRRQVL